MIITDVNEAPSMGIFVREVEENKVKGTLIGAVVLGTDPDDPKEPFGTLNYTITG